MRPSLRNLPPEIVIAGATLAIMFAFSLALGLPVVLPSGDRAAFVGVHYLYPLIGVALLGAITFVAGKRDVAMSFLIALPCYVVILFAHFNLKLWIPHINPVMFDDFYWATDELVRPVVDACIYLRTHLFGFISYESNFYMISFMALFYTSFLYHAVKTPKQFRTLVVSVLLVQALGALAYLVAPAIGPFLYERGVDPGITTGQMSMLEFYRGSIDHGPAWIAQHGGANFTVGLAAMPSLHAAGAFLFFLFAWRHGRILLPLYSMILFFILVTSIASRWHYVIDVPVGIALAWACVWMAERMTGEVKNKAADEASGPALPVAA
ncbi:phosphatase PAP2 family protein [Sphingopyxis sp. KK2]|uniref:phosphatase PAP2 family protein n=1 Tax=Sphingopyxis sp. KK2 TaxID=1855727 RepID=UPI00097E70E8|nr:phosphatase PAP2 family protein [Sphingopyxis sp. KK2]